MLHFSPSHFFSCLQQQVETQDFSDSAKPEKLWYEDLEPANECKFFKSNSKLSTNFCFITVRKCIVCWLFITSELALT